MRSFIIFIITLTSAYCSGQKLTLHIYNKTGYDVDSINLQGIYVGHIAKDSSVTLTLNNREIKMQDGAPFYPIADGVIKKLNRDTTKHIYGFCGTGVTYIDSGDFSFDLNNPPGGKGYSLWWDAHR